MSERGTHRELLEQNGWYRKQYERQQLSSLEEGDGRMKTGRRLWNYALQYKKLLIWAVVLLIIAVGTELTYRLSEKMIDDHILGIEKHGLKPLRTIRAPSGSGA